MTIKILTDELLFLLDDFAWADSPRQGTLIAYAQAFKPIEDALVEKCQIPRGSIGWFRSAASHVFLTWVVRRVGIKMSITSAKQLPNQALSMIARWLDGHHPDWTIEDEVDILDRKMAERQRFVLNLLGAICPRVRPLARVDEPWDHPGMEGE